MAIAFLKTSALRRLGRSMLGRTLMPMFGFLCRRRARTLRASRRGAFRLGRTARQMRGADRAHRDFYGWPGTALTSADIRDAGGLSVLPGYASLRRYRAEKRADCCRRQKQVSHHDRPPFTQI